MPPQTSNTLGVALELILAGLGGLIFAFWAGLVIWTFKDIRNRTTDIFAIILASLMVLVFGPLGALLYLLLRPTRTLSEAYDRYLEEEALLRSVEERESCPHCHRTTKEDWLVCPYCHTALRRTCANCEHQINVEWDVCPYCATPQEPVKTTGKQRALPPLQKRAEPQLAATANGGRSVLANGRSGSPTQQLPEADEDNTAPA